MIVGVLRETAPRESRVALTPGNVRELSTAGLQVVVEEGAGRGAGFADSAYRASGALVVGDRTAVFERSDIVAWVKPPAFELASMPLRAGTTMVGFQDPHYRRDVIDRLRGLGVESVAFDSVPRDDTTTEIDALTTMSRIAGAVGYAEGRQLLSPQVRSRPVRALVLGCGAAGLAAIAAARTFDDEKPGAVGNRLEQEIAALGAGAGRFVPNQDDNAALLDLLATTPPDLIIGTAAHRGSRAPRLLEQASLELLAPGTVIVDLVAKAGGNCVATVPDTTVTLPNGVIVTHRSNYPTARPTAASRAYGAATAAMILCIASGQRSADGRARVAEAS
ncbi:hypothetical protein IU459_00350 [Nocardia amamiensis]|uniref:proton-translocating NAD(P)(+) transhydrogenase n=1 Tax=Nocardia amamiensis TaxID=404578 RepID=A0ABS0CML5_9NOCA|nr:hypothetical protein [Nocardia amamiensis]MBF6295993.1 hypothetical protein [Nocardia amamiensis]